MQIILLLIVILLVLLILAVKKDSISNLNKFYIALILVIIVGAIMIYQFNFSEHEKQNRILINAYKQGETISCNGMDINNKTYRLETGTLSFMAKRDNKELKGIIHDIGDCVIKE